MNAYYSDELSFSEVCKILKKHDNKKAFPVLNAIAVATSVLAPVMAAGWSPMANAVNITAQIATLSASSLANFVQTAAMNVSNLFDRSDNFSNYCEDMQCAQTLLIYTAFFDAVKDKISVLDNNLTLNGDEQVRISVKALAAYADKFREEKSTSGSGEILKNLPFPVPFTTFQGFLENITEYYKILADQLIMFYTQLSITENGGDVLLPSLHKALAVLPTDATKCYKAQYWELIKCFPEFSKWTVITTQQIIYDQVIQISEQLKSLPAFTEKSEEVSVISLEKLRKKYEKHIKSAILNSRQRDQKAGIRFPSRLDSFIPQRFIIDQQDNTDTAIDSSVQSDLFENMDIGEAIQSIFMHPVNGLHPVMILGHPGSGKTTLCYMLAARSFVDSFHTIIIRLRSINPRKTISEQIDNALKQEEVGNFCWNDLRSARLTKPILLIFDGYDELLQVRGEEFSGYLKKVDDFLSNEREIHENNVYAIITSRKSLWDPSKVPNYSSVITLLEFSDLQIERWCTKWNDTNRDYFCSSGLRPLTVDLSSQAGDLARQPILLFMIALYDAYENRFQKGKDLKRVQLYDNLISDYIEREHEKDGTSVKKEIQEMSYAHLEAAALGMFNRDYLFITDQELNCDISFLDNGQVSRMLKHGALTPAVQTFGGFFFVHCSDAKADDDSDGHAYEFLHNTFGEFLVSRHMLGAIRNVLLNQPCHRDLIYSFCYSPLCLRPVIIEMLQEASLCFLPIQLSMMPEQIHEKWSDFLRSELTSCASGEIVSQLISALDEVNNPYPRKNLFTHLAYYSQNLVITGTVICGNSFDYGKVLGEAVWQKLALLWKSVYSEDELLRFEYCFKQIRRQGTSILAIKEHREHWASQNPLLQNCLIASILGDDFTKVVSGTLCVFPEKSNILNCIQELNLPIASNYLHQYFIHGLFFGNMDPRQALRLLEEYYLYVPWKSKYSLFFFSTLESALRAGIISPDDRDVSRIIENALTQTKDAASDHFNPMYGHYLPLYHQIINVLSIIKPTEIMFHAVLMMLPLTYMQYNNKQYLNVVTSQMELSIRVLGYIYAHKKMLNEQDRSTIDNAIRGYDNLLVRTLPYSQKIFSSFLSVAEYLYMLDAHDLSAYLLNLYYSQLPDDGYDHKHTISCNPYLMQKIKVLRSRNKRLTDYPELNAFLHSI